MTYTLGVLGVGGFASYLLAGFVRHDPNISVILSPRNKNQVRKLEKSYGFTPGKSNRHVVEEANTILLSTRPAYVDAAISGLPWRPDQLLISVAAGITYQELVHKAAPANVVICMPTNSGMIGTAAVPMYPSNPRAERLLIALGKTIVMREEAAYEAAASLGAYYGWLIELTRESVNWLQTNGCDEPQARELVTTTLSAVANVVAHRGDQSLEYLVDELRVPGGLTAHGLDMFIQSGAIQEWPKVLSAIRGRLSQKY